MIWPSQSLARTLDWYFETISREGPGITCLSWAKPSELVCSTLHPDVRVCEASQRHSTRTPPQHAGKLYTMQPSVLSSWRRVRGHACRQAIGVLLFALYTSCLWRIWPDSAHWPNKHNFFRRQWVEGMLWCDSTELWCLPFQASLPGMGVHHITRLCSYLPCQDLCLPKWTHCAVSGSLTPTAGISQGC